jgi:sugar transferase (PEP-CTERM system associated)
MVRVFSHWIPAHTLFQIVFDLVLLCLSLILAIFWFERGDLRGAAAVFPYALLFALGMVVVNLLFGVYQRDAERSLFRTAALVILCFVVAVPMAYGMLSPMPRPPAWRDEITLALLLALGVMVAIRGHALGRGGAPLLSRRVLVLGTGAEAAVVEQSFTRSGPHVRVVGFYPVRSDGEMQVDRNRVLADSDSLAAAARRLKVDEIVVAVHDRRGIAVPLPELLDCRLAGMRVLDLSSHFEQALGQVRLDSLRASWLIFGEGFRQGLLRKTVKRLSDLVAATILLGVFWPVMLLSAILIVLESGFPILYRQERVGLGGSLFDVVKFRSMRPDAERDGQPRWATGNDQRVTRVGRILRKLRIDELPQLYNVLKGDMSLCGPRPERPYFVTYLTREIPFYAARHSVKPGVTGWAQVRYPYGESVDDAIQKLQYDLYYVKNHTLFLDTVILFETVGVVLTGAGAR